MPQPTVSIYLDTRRAKKSTDKDKKKGDAAPPPDEPARKGKEIYPVKIRVYYNGTTRYYPTGTDLTEGDFEKSYLAEKPRGDMQTLKIKIASHLTRTQDIINNMGSFSFDKLEKQLYRPTGAGQDVFYHYTQKINLLKEEEHIKTASNYELSQKSIKAYLKAKGLKDSRLTFEAVTPKFLNDYERWMLKEGKELTTVSMYTRALRTLFNDAIRDGEIDKEIYPFKKGGYEVPAGNNVKKALTKADLKKLFEAEIEEADPMNKARDFFFFSYQCNGMNVRDICELKYRNLDNGKIAFVRTKTKKTTKSKQRTIIAIVTPFVEAIIKKYGNHPLFPDTYIFPIYTPSMDAAEKVRKAEAFTRFINQHIKKLAKKVGVDENISTYYARHSFSTISVQNGASLEFIQDSLGHASINTTMNYWKGFADDVKADIAGKLMDFSTEESEPTTSADQ